MNQEWLCSEKLGINPGIFFHSYQHKDRRVPRLCRHVHSAAFFELGIAQSGENLVMRVKRRPQAIEVESL